MGESAGLGTWFLRESATPGTYDRIAQVATITPPQLQRDTVEVEDLAPADDFKKKLVGLIDGGDMSLTLNFDPELQGHKDLEDDFHAGLTHSYQIKFKSGGYYTVSGVVTQFAPQEITAGDVLQAEVTIAVDSKPEYTDAPTTP